MIRLDSENSSGLVILFALNELPALKQLMKRKVPDDWSILVFDGRSTDGSQQWLTNNGVNWFEQQSSQGKGNAIREFFSETKKMNYSYYAFMDADCTCLFSDLPKLKTQLDATSSDIIIGTRMKGFREQSIECQKNGTQIIVKCNWSNKPEHYVIVCKKYDTTCSSKVCFKERFLKEE